MKTISLANLHECALGLPYSCSTSSVDYRQIEQLSRCRMEALNFRIHHGYFLNLLVIGND